MCIRDRVCNTEKYPKNICHLIVEIVFFSLLEGLVAIQMCIRDRYIKGKAELWPLPQSEIDTNSAIIENNPGY